MNKRTRQLLQLISAASDGLQYFQIYRRLYMTPEQIAISLKMLQSEQLVEVTGNRVKSTEKGFLMALGASTRWSGGHESNTQSWKVVPSEFVAPRIPINVPYAPSIKTFLKQSKKD